MKVAKSRYLRFWECKLAIAITLLICASQFVSFLWSKHAASRLEKHLRVVSTDQILLCAQAEVPISPRNAYVQYATSHLHINLALINFISLREAKTRVDELVVLFELGLADDLSNWLSLLNIADKYSIKLRAVMPLRGPGSHESSLWHASFSKIHVFGLDDYDRIVYFDSDSMVANHNRDFLPTHMDELFALPPTVKYALPRAYWLDESQARWGTPPSFDAPSICDFRAFSPLLRASDKYHDGATYFATHIMVIKPSKTAFTELSQYVKNEGPWRVWGRTEIRDRTDYDMEIINRWLNTQLIAADKSKASQLQVVILPHRTYGALTGELGEKHHAKYMTDARQMPYVNRDGPNDFSAAYYLREAKLIHFSDAPLPKPWSQHGRNGIEPHFQALIPTCDAKIKTDESDSLYLPQKIVDCDSASAWHKIRQHHAAQRSKFWVVD